LSTPAQLPQESGPATPATPPEDSAPKPRIHHKSSDPDLRYKFWALLGQYASLSIAIIGFAAVLYSINANTRSLRANVQNSIGNHVLNLDKIFVDKPELLPYFYDGKVPDPSDKNYLQLVAVTQSFADTMDVLSDQVIRFRDEWENPEAWDIWLDDCLRKSPIRVKYLRDHRGWYGHSLMQRVDRVAPKGP
jgi:hypothetical protein